MNPKGLFHDFVPWCVDVFRSGCTLPRVRGGVTLLTSAFVEEGLCSRRVGLGNPRIYVFFSHSQRAGELYSTFAEVMATFTKGKNDLNMLNF